jgi:hypothetical protein
VVSAVAVVMVGVGVWRLRFGWCGRRMLGVWSGGCARIVRVGQGFGRRRSGVLGRVWAVLIGERSAALRVVPSFDVGN